MKNIEILKLEGKLQNQAVIDLLQQESYLEKSHIDEIMSLGETGLSDMRLILQAYLDNIQDVKKSSTTVTPFFQIVCFLTDLKDEKSFDLMINYLKSDFDLIDDTFNDSIIEVPPCYFAMFPHRIADIVNCLYDKEMNYCIKNTFVDALVQMTIIHKDEKIKSEVVEALQNHLKFLSIPENRFDFALEGSSRTWIDMHNYTAFIITDLHDLEADLKQNYIESLFEQDVVEEGIFGDLDELSKIKPEVFRFYDSIYNRNESWERAVQHQERGKRERLAKEILKQRMDKFTKIYSRNDKVNVKYHNGTILKDVKFKKVEDDLIDDKCEIIG